MLDVEQPTEQAEGDEVIEIGENRITVVCIFYSLSSRVYFLRQTQTVCSEQQDNTAASKKRRSSLTWRFRSSYPEPLKQPLRSSSRMRGTRSEMRFDM
jgi:hypothetical protein